MSNIAPFALLAVLITTGCGPASSTGRKGTSGPTLDEIIPWFKIEYFPKTPKSPAYLPGQPAVVPITQLAGVFSTIGSDVDVTKASYDYCNKGVGS